MQKCKEKTFEVISELQNVLEIWNNIIAPKICKKNVFFLITFVFLSLYPNSSFQIKLRLACIDVYNKGRNSKYN